MAGTSDTGGDGLKRSFRSDVRSVWRKVKEFVPDVLALGDMFGDVLDTAFDLGKEIFGLLKRVGGRLGAFGVALGSTSPLSDGWGLEWLSAPAWRAWLPVVGLPVGLLVVRGVRASFRHLDDESERDRRRQEKELVQPDVVENLEEEIQLRDWLNQTVATSVPTRARAKLSDSDIDDALKLASRRLISRDPLTDMVLVLLRWKKGTLREEARCGTLDKQMRACLAIGWDKVISVDRVLREALAPFEYTHVSVPFSVGSRQYLLLGLSGAPIDGHAHLEISRTTTRLVEGWARGIEEQLLMRNDRWS